MPSAPPPPTSPNFAFLAPHQPFLLHLALATERYVFDDPSAALVKLRLFAESIARQVLADVGVETGPQETFESVLYRLRDNRAATLEVLDLFHGIRKAGNAAAHEGLGTRSESLHQLRQARQLAIWFDRSRGTANKSYGPFVSPPNPTDASAALVAELERLREAALKQQVEIDRLKLSATEVAEAKKRSDEEATRAFAELTIALDLAAETEVRLEAERRGFEKQLTDATSQATSKTSAEVEAVLERTRKAAALVEMDEAATRRIIDRQLREAGWEADSETLRHALGVRPQKGKNLAIAEWPTAEGPADYVLFIGLTPVGTVEAKRANEDVCGKVGQASRYSRGFQVESTMVSPGGPWEKHALPLCFSTNGRPYLRQLETKSGIWFRDIRKPSNLARALEGWYTPDGVEALLKADSVAAEAKLASEPTEYLPLRDYQLNAVRAVEDAISSDRRSMLVAMATGTGKTVTCLGLIYRLLKSGRFRRVLFLVDRTSLEQQAFEKFEAIKLEGLRAITEIYDVKRLGDLVPDPDTRLHFGTVQGLVQRILYADDSAKVPPVDAYDCVVVDECHRGYTIDRELSDAELSFRDEADYISKYRRVLDHFDAVKVGLTATPAQHTEEIFGAPVYQYSYRQAWSTAEGLRQSAFHQLDELDQLDQSILAKAFRGELVPQDPTDDPASVLLERIRSDQNEPKALKAITRGKLSRIVLLLLHHWNNAASRELVDRGVLLMLDDDLRQRLASGGAKAKRKKRGKPIPATPISFPHLLGAMIDAEFVTAKMKGTVQTLHANTQKAKLAHDTAEPADLARLRETMKVMELIEEKQLDAELAEAFRGQEIALTV